MELTDIMREAQQALNGDYEQMVSEKRGIAVVKFGYHDVKADDPYCTGRAYGVYFEGDMELTTPAQYYEYGDKT